MKKINYNIILFAVAMCLIIGGWCSKVLLGGFKQAVETFIKDHDIEMFIDNVNAASKNISYKGTLVDLYSISYRITDTRVVKKDDSTVVKMDNGYLNMAASDVSDENIDKMVESCVNLKKTTDELNIPFLYISAPNKSDYDKSENEYQQDRKRFVDELRESGINVLDLKKEREQQGYTMEETFFITDHHWTPEAGFWASGEICKKLNRDYNFEYDEQKTDIFNYNIKIYENWFLGSIGKKVGRFFTNQGVDDISLITPKFETNLKVTTSETREGSFENTVIYQEYLNEKDLYEQNPYGAYCGGDWPLQIITNNMGNENGKKVLVIKDSFAGVVNPYLALQTNELHIWDIRHWQPTESTPTLSDYIKQEQFDCVMILYSDISLVFFDFK